jgi:hypothetical protein
VSAPWREARLLLRGPERALGEAMSRLPRGSRCRVIVSSSLARYALVPFSTAVVGRQANETLAAQVFRATHGERVDGWRVRLAPGGALRIACALDASLVEAITETARERGVRLTGIEPALAAGYNAAYRRLPRSCWFAVLEQGKAILALLIDGTWRHLSAERCSGEGTGVLARLLAREAMLAEDAPAGPLACWVARFAAEDDAPLASGVPSVEAFA